MINPPAQEQIPQPQLLPDLTLINESLFLPNDVNNTSDILANQEKDKLIKDGKRGEQYRMHIHLIVVTGMYVLGLIMIALALVRAFHFVAPEQWRWLSETDSHGIERILFSGIILSFATKYFKKYKVVDD